MKYSGSTANWAHLMKMVIDQLTRIVQIITWTNFLFLASERFACKKSILDIQNDDTEITERLFASHFNESTWQCSAISCPLIVEAYNRNALLLTRHQLVFDDDVELHLPWRNLAVAWRRMQYSTRSEDYVHTWRSLLLHFQ